MYTFSAAIVVVLSMLSATISPVPPHVDAVSGWKTYNLPNYDYTIQVPATWKVFPPNTNDSAFSYERTLDHDSFFFYARYYVPDPTRDLYADLVRGVASLQDFLLANGRHAILVTGQSCRAVAWIYHRIERYLSWCGDDQQEEQLFMEIARRIDAPSRQTGAVVNPPANPRLPKTMRTVVNSIIYPTARFTTPADWTAYDSPIWFPKRWTVGIDDANGMCTMRECTPYAATPGTGSTEEFYNRTATTVWASFTTTRLDYDNDPYGWFLLDPTYYGHRITLANGKTAFLFARNQGDYEEYVIIRVEAKRYMTLIARIGNAASTPLYRADVAAILRSVYYTQPHQ